MKILRVAVLGLALVAVSPAVAIEAVRLAQGERMTLDGNLDEPAWARAQKLDRFWEIFPTPSPSPG